LKILARIFFLATRVVILQQKFHSWDKIFFLGTRIFYTNLKKKNLVKRFFQGIFAGDGGEEGSTLNPCSTSACEYPHLILSSSLFLSLSHASANL